MTLQSAAPAASKVSLLAQYGNISAVRKRKAAPRVLPIVIDDPYARGEPAHLSAPPRGAKTRSAKGEWIAPAKKPIEIYASFRSVIAGMFARGHADKAMFLAAQKYAAVYALAMAGQAKGIDPSAPVVSGGKGGDVIVAVVDASKQLARLEGPVAQRYGLEAVEMLRDVLACGLSIKQAAQRRGHGDRQGVEWSGRTLRLGLEELTSAAGFAVKNAYANRAREEKRRDDEHRKAERKEREALKAKREKRK